MKNGSPQSLEMPVRKYIGDGRCVFCLKKFETKDLTDEHIVPDAINGRAILLKGSCGPCAKESNKAYENEALESDLKVARLILGLRGKSGGRPRDVRHMPKVFRGDVNTLLHDAEAYRLLNFGLDEYPRYFTLLNYKPAGLLAKVDRGSILTGASLRIYSRHPGGITNVTVKQKHTIIAFPMMIAKIAYCYAVGELGIDGFDGSQIRDLLKGRRQDVFNFVGNAADPERLSSRHLHACYFRNREGRRTVVVDLFASLGPKVRRPYEVVVGD